jgi:hypothetical protein
MTQDNKRRFITQLPAINQTDPIKNFFASTVDELFQPGSSEPISGYIGQKPVYYDPTKDFYITESTPARTTYQLEPAMISTNTGGIITNTLTYDDLINYLDSQGALTNNHSRMFEGEYYSWAPPVDLDKLNNYLQYYWMGSLSSDDANATAITLHAPRSTYIYDGHTVTYNLPSPIAELNGEGQIPMVLVNGEQAEFNINSTTNMATISNAGLTVGDIVETFLYGDLVQAIEGQTTLDMTPFLTWINQIPNYQTRQIVNNFYDVGELASGQDAYGNTAVYICTASHQAQTQFYPEIANYWQLAVNAQMATSGFRVKLVDGIGVTDSAARSFILDGVGQGIELTTDNMSDPAGFEPIYVVIDRRSSEKSPWALRNLWVHKKTLEWTGKDYSSHAAQRPIIEFLPNIELYNYGSNRLPDVQATMSNTYAQVSDNWDVYPFDSGVWDQDKVDLSHINGQFFGKLHDPKYTGGTLDDTSYLGSVMVDNGYILQPNDRMFVMQDAPTDPSLNNVIYTVISNPETPLPSGATADVVELVFAGAPQRGDIFRISKGGTTSIFADPVEYWFNGTQWVIAQNGMNVPLFRLFDSEENALDDTGSYPGSNFVGTKLFSYEIGNGTVDPIIGVPLVYNSFNQPVFVNDPVVNRVTYNIGEIPGFYYHHVIDPTQITTGTYNNNWYPLANASIQTIDPDGFYEIPLNLQANPDNEEVTTITRNQWFDQFSEIMTNQTNFVGQPFSINNWRDTARVLDFGNEILQHRSPLLKTMLLASNTNFDLAASLVYAELEYVRYRSIFVQTILNFYKNGTLLSTDLPATWVSKVLQQQRLNKNSQFPFAYSNMAGGQYFMPPTPASLGVDQVAVPGIVNTTVLGVTMTMIRGHDGSLTPAFGDFRDQIMAQLELTIYNNIPAQFKTEARPIFDLKEKIGGKFFSSDLSYSQNEITEMVTPYFLRWAQTNRLDYRNNTSFDESNPFTWNYSKTLDKDNQSVPGNWVGIYELYYDTYQPHLAPWEMLGFIDKPSYWDTTYGPSPYTSGNLKLWNDLRDGVIVGGVRQGIDPRYARPALYSYLPVDAQGNLLDPIAAGIIPNAPTVQQAGANWVVGDYGPVETLWRLSSSFDFAMAQAGFLAKPPRFVEQGWDTINQIQDSTGQWIYAPTGDRPQNSDIFVHGEVGTDGVTVTVVTGIQQWISDYIVSRGQNPSVFGESVRGLDVRLVHKMAGFVSGDNLSASADNFGLVPAADFSVQLYNSPSTGEFVYSGVLVEKVQNGWQVIGYDTRKPWFTVIPGLQTGPKGVISLSTTPEVAFAIWKPGVYYTNSIKVAFNGTLYACIKAHTSGQAFNPSFWDIVGPVPTQAPRVVTYQVGDVNHPQTVPYGTIFNNYQQVADFMQGYGRYLTSIGFDFTSVNSTIQQTIDWNLMTKEFLGWAQVTWQNGNFITLSPAAYESGLIFNTDQGYVLNMLTSINGTFGLVDRTGTPINRKNIVVNRIDSQTTILSKLNDLYGARLNVAEIEHALIFNNSTIFGDIIYDPLFNLRQPRMLLIGFRSADWAGRMDAPGFMLIDNQIQSNFFKAAQDLVTMFDIENGDNATYVNHARHNIGYDSRDYLSSLVLSEIEQVEFYQGMIHQKGASGAFNKLLRSDFIDQNRDLMFFEEWAVLQSEYGAVNDSMRIAFLFGQSQILRDPQYIEFRVTDANSVVSVPDTTWIELQDTPTAGIDSKWVERPIDPLQAFAVRDTLVRQPGDVPVAGYVRLNEIDHTVFNSDSVIAIYDSNAGVTLPAGEVVWVHQNEQVRDISASSTQQQWYVLGTNTGGGFWDGSNITTLANSYTTIDEGQLVFVSHTGDAPFITDDAQFVPVPGQTYRVTFNVSKTVAQTNGVSSYVRPAFDAFDANNSITGALGTKSGFGYNSSLDLIDTTNWVIGQYYPVSAEWTCPATPAYASARGRLRINRTYPTDSVGATYSNAVYEVNSSTITVNQPVEWDALKVYNLSIDGSVNTVANVVTTTENATIANTIMRVYTVGATGLTVADKGLFFIIDGMTFSDSELQGMHTIYDVGADYVDIQTSGKHGYDFASLNLTGPQVRILRSTHFANLTEFVANQSRAGSQEGDLAYVDGAAGQPWRVYTLSEVTEQTDDYDPSDGLTLPVTYRFWNVVRSQPPRIDARGIKGSTIYDLKTKITTTDLQPEPLSLNSITVVSPLTGVLPGLAMTEIDYMLDYDPALYNNVPIAFDEDGNPGFAMLPTGVDKWGPAQVGRVWWNMSTVRFLETETDFVSLGFGDPGRYNDEVRYRIANWGQIAPQTSIDVYEWVRSDVEPLEYMALVQTDTTGTYVGEVLNSDNPSWVQSEEYVGNVPTTFFYFWVKGIDTVPAVTFRTRSVETVSQLLINPMIEDEPWIAPIMPNGVLVGGVTPFVDDVFDTDSDGAAVSGTVVQIEVKNLTDYEGVVHEEWFLLRPNDELSIPPNWLWDKLRDSLVGFDDSLNINPASIVVPNPAAPVNKLPVWYTGPGQNDVPINQ